MTVYSRKAIGLIALHSRYSLEEQFNSYVITVAKSKTVLFFVGTAGRCWSPSLSLLSPPPPPQQYTWVLLPAVVTSMTWWIWELLLITSDRASAVITPPSVYIFKSVHYETRARIFKLLWSPLDSKEPIPPGCVA